MTNLTVKELKAFCKSKGIKECPCGTKVYKARKAALVEAYKAYHQGSKLPQTPKKNQETKISGFTIFGQFYCLDNIIKVYDEGSKWHIICRQKGRYGRWVDVPHKVSKGKSKDFDSYCYGRVGTRSKTGKAQVVSVKKRIKDAWELRSGIFSKGIHTFHKSSIHCVTEDGQGNWQVGVRVKSARVDETYLIPQGMSEAIDRQLHGFQPTWGYNRGYFIKGSLKFRQSDITVIVNDGDNWMLGVKLNGKVKTYFIPSYSELNELLTNLSHARQKRLLAR